jgi:hypothetical protein
MHLKRKGGDLMGMFLKPSKSGKSLNVYVGKGINGRPFDGKKLTGKSGTKQYSHLNLEQRGGSYVSRPKGGSLYRAAGQRGKP